MCKSNNKYNVNDEVFWTDPDRGCSNGYYKVINVIHDNCGSTNIYMVSNGQSEA